MKLVIVITAIILGVTLGYYFPKNNSITDSKNLDVKKTQFSIDNQPEKSLIGKIFNRSGEILYESRTATISSLLKNDENTIKQGEKITTEKNGQLQVNFDDSILIEIGNNSELYFAQTLPHDLVINQKNGLVTYEIKNQTTLSVRMRSALITKQEGKIEIEMESDNPIIKIRTLKGTAKIAFNDLDFNTQYFDLREGQEYEYNSDDRTAINSKNK